mgnify:CR=1 FL=1
MFSKKVVTSDNKFIKSKSAAKKPVAAVEKKKKVFPVQKILDVAWKPKEYSLLTNKDKDKAYFILNRFMAIQYPIHAAVVNRMNMNTSAVVDYWVYTLRKLYNATPGWFYTKVNKNFSIDIGSNTDKLDKELIALYIKVYECSSKDLTDGLLLDSENTKNKLDELQGLLDWEKTKVNQKNKKE